MVWRASWCSMRSGWCTSRSWEKPLSRGRRMPARTGSVSTSWPSYWTPCRRSDNHVHMFWINKDIYHTQSPHKASTQPHALSGKYIPVLVNLCISTVSAALSLECPRSTSATGTHQSISLRLELETYPVYLYPVHFNSFKSHYLTHDENKVERKGGQDKMDHFNGNI